MEGTVSIDGEIMGLLCRHGALSVAFMTRFLNERGVSCTRQKVERTLRRLIRQKKVESFCTNRNGRKHYRLR